VIVNVVAVIAPTIYPVLGIAAAALAGVRLTVLGAVVYVLPNVTVITVAPVEVPVVVITPAVSLPPAVIAAAVIPACVVTATVGGTALAVEMI